MSAIVDKLADDTLAYASALGSATLLGGDWAEVDATVDRIHDGLIALSHQTRASQSGAAHELEYFGGER